MLLMAIIVIPSSHTINIVDTWTVSLEITCCSSVLKRVRKGAFKRVTCARCFKRKSAILPPSSVPISTSFRAKVAKNMVILGDTFL